jgi:topoisomerase IA-like protein
MCSWVRATCINHSVFLFYRRAIHFFNPSGTTGEADSKKISVRLEMFNKAIATYLNLEDAVKLLELPRLVCMHPELNEPVTLHSSSRGS